MTCSLLVASGCGADEDGVAGEDEGEETVTVAAAAAGRWRGVYGTYLGLGAGETTFS